jgi:beta-glucanase (GH16 family)
MRRILGSRRHLATAPVAALVAVLALALWLPGNSGGIGGRSGWRLVLNEDFRGHALDARRWRTCFWWATTTCSIEPNGELQLYTRANVAVAGGDLTLSARRQSRVGWNGKRYAYTSGMVMSGGRGARGRRGFAFTYGRAEARIKVPRGAGLLPAFWLLPASGASRPEIDVMEILGGSPSVDRMHVHYAGTGGRTDAAARNWTGPDFSAGWHTFAVDWEPHAITWSVDGVRRWRVTRPAAIPHQPMYLLLTLAVGGDFPGPPDGATVFPNQLRVASVRVWQHRPVRR